MIPNQLAILFGLVAGVDGPYDLLKNLVVCSQNSEMYQMVKGLKQKY